MVTIHAKTIKRLVAKNRKRAYPNGYTLFLFSNILADF